MTQNQCPGCQRRLPKQHGVHYAEQEMIACTAQRYRPQPGPVVSEVWHKARKGGQAPIAGGGV